MAVETELVPPPTVPADPKKTDETKVVLVSDSQIEDNKADVTQVEDVNSKDAKGEDIKGEDVKDEDENGADADTAEPFAKLQSKVQELEKALEKLTKKAADKAEKQQTEEEKSCVRFGSIIKVRLAIHDPMEPDSDEKKKEWEKEKEEHNTWAIVAYYDILPSDVDLFKLWETDLGTPNLPVRVAINSKRILKHLQKISDTTLNESRCIMMPPYKIFVTYWAEIEGKIKSLKEEFEKEYKEKWGAKADETDPAADDGPEAKKPSVVKTKEELTKEDASQDIEHLECLFKFMDKYLGDIPALQGRIKDKFPYYQFHELWHLFNPGDIVIGRSSVSEREKQAYKVFSVTKGRFKMRESSSERSKVSQTERHRNSLQIQCVFLDYDGTKIDNREEVLHIKPYVGYRYIKNLDYYPKEFAHKEEIEALEKRGKKFILSRYGHGMVSGITSRFEIEHLDNEEVFVDFKSGYEALPAKWKEESWGFGIKLPECQNDETYEPSCGTRGCVICPSIVYLDEQVDVNRALAFKKTLSAAIDKEEKIDALKTSPDLILLPRHLLAFTLRTKEWHFVDVHDYKKIKVTKEECEKGWKNLVISDDTKRVLRAMVADHATTMATDKSVTRSGTAIDITKGKGRGRIIFLHGNPGVGKTSTAETIAAYTIPPRPLYPITCGDLGSDPKAIQDALDGHFKLAHRWNCVLLLDEADVYLAERTHNDLERNGIVSVFLRTLEYYSGILFLTSNRSSSIDPAFKSRIHLALEYKDIDLKGTIDIWNNIIDGIKADNAKKKVKVKIIVKKEHLLKWAEEHYRSMQASKIPTWNGRQIRNAFQSAIALASYDRLERISMEDTTEKKVLKDENSKLRDVKLLVKHFDEVSSIVQQFERYLISCGKGPDKAKNEGLGPRDPNAKSRFKKRAELKEPEPEPMTETLGKLKVPAQTKKNRRPSQTPLTPVASPVKKVTKREVIRTKKVVEQVENEREDGGPEEEEEPKPRFNLRVNYKGAAEEVGDEDDAHDGGNGVVDADEDERDDSGDDQEDEEDEEEDEEEEEEEEDDDDEEEEEEDDDDDDDE